MTRTRSPSQHAQEGIRARPSTAKVPSAVPGPATLPGIQRTLGNARVQRLLAQRSASGAGGEVAPGVGGAIQRARGGGRGLDAGVRGAMEAAFGTDFGGVRVHTGPRADTLNRALHARAFTTGSDIFFRGGEYAPSSPGGKELLAHELTHVVQQAGARVQAKLRVGAPDDACEREADRVAERVVSGKAADAVLVGDGTVVRRQTPPVEPPVEEKPAAEGAAEEEKAPDPAAVATEVAGILSGISGADLKRSWKSLKSQITTPRAAGKKPGAIQKKYPALYTAGMVEKLEKLTAEQRAAVAEDVFWAVGAEVTGAEAADLKTEFETTLSKRLRANIEGGAAGYVAVRAGLLGAFGSLAKANEYFGSLVSADFPRAGSSVRGRATPVHPDLKTRLKKAADLLAARKVGEKTMLEVAEAGIAGIGGFNVRENRNSPGSLSDHSFGWAIDIDASLNPNVRFKNFPRSLVEAFTGEDVYKGAATTAFRTGGTFDELLPHATTLRSASDTFKDAFSSEDSLKAAARKYVAGKGVELDDPKTDEMWALVTATGKEKELRKKLATWLSDQKLGPAAPAPAAEPGAEPAPAPPSKPEERWSEAPAAASLLLSAWKVFQGTGVPKGKKVGAAVSGTPATIAAHGFISLPAELIAALTASDGGGLRWLGDVKERSTKDFMHFELKDADEPELPREAAEPAPAAGEAAPKEGEP